MKNRFLFLFLFFPLFSFGDWYVKPWYWTSSNLSNSDPSVSYSAECRSSPSSSPLPAFFNGLADSSAPVWFGVAINNFNNSLVYPATFPPRGGVSNSTASVHRFIRDSDLPNVYFHPSAFPDVVNLYNFASSLFVAGYRGQGFQVFNAAKFNFNPPLLFADVVNGTNSVFKAQLFDFLGSLSSGVNQLVINSDSGLSSFRDFVSDYSSLNYYSLSPTSAVVSSSSVLYDNPVFWFGSQSSYPFNDVVNSISQSLDLQDTSFPDSSARRAFVSDALKSVLSDSLKAFLLDQSSGVRRNFSDYVSDPSLAQSVIAGHYSTPFTNGVMQGAKKISDDVRESLSNNTQQIKKQLADWHNFASNGVKEVNGNLSTIVGNTSSSALKSAIESANIHIGDSVHVVLDGPVTIDSEQFNSVSVPLGSLKDTADNWYSQWADFYFSSTPQKGWVKFFDLVSDFKEVNHSDLVSIESCVSNLLVSFSSYTNGLPFAISNAIAGLSLSSTNSYLLLSDYADYIHSGGLDSLLDIMDDDSYSDLKAEVGSLYHADTAEGYGRWWRYFTGLSTVQANSIFKLSNIFQAHEKLLKDLKRDNSDLGVQDVSDSSVFRKLLYTIPSDEDTFNKLSQLTNSIDQSGMVRVQQLIPDLTNRFSVAASLYDKDFVLPSEISWTLIPGDSSINSPSRVVTICPSQHYRLFQMLHFGLAFSYCLVNIILFPKFLLFLVRLFDRVWNKSEKLIYNSTQS